MTCKNYTKFFLQQDHIVHYHYNFFFFILQSQVEERNLSQKEVEKNDWKRKNKKENQKTKVKDNTKISLRDLIVVIINRHKILKWLMCLKTGEKMENLTRELEPIEIIQILEKYIVTEIKNVTKIAIAIRHHKTKDQWTRRW